VGGGDEWRRGGHGRSEGGEEELVRVKAGVDEGGCMYQC
jgi:hypothetical protein